MGQDTDTWFSSISDPESHACPVKVKVLSAENSAESQWEYSLAENPSLLTATSSCLFLFGKPQSVRTVSLVI